MRVKVLSVGQWLTSFTFASLAMAQENRMQAQGYPSYFATTVITETVFAACASPEPSVAPSLCTTSTDLILPNNAVLSGVTVHPVSSPSSCYSLPTPMSSLDMIAYHTSDEEFSDSENGTASPHDPLFFYMGDNATSPQYVGTTINGSRTVLDLSSDAMQRGHIALSLPGGQSLVFNNDGMHLYHNDCEAVSSVSIANFTHQLRSIGQLPVNAPCRRGFLKRQVQETNFTVEMRLNKSVDADTPQPNMTFGESPCEFISLSTGADADVCSWTCQVPGEFSGEKKCERAFESWMNGTSGSQLPSPKNVSNLLDYVTPFLQQIGASVDQVLPALSPIVNQVVPFLYTAHQAVANTLQFGGLALCKLLHANDEYNLLMQLAGVSTVYTVGAFVTPPDSTISGNLVKPTASPTREPPRIVYPGQPAFLSMLAFSISSPPALPTLGVPGLPGRDAGVFESTTTTLTEDSPTSLATDLGL